MIPTLTLRNGFSDELIIDFINQEISLRKYSKISNECAISENQVNILTDNYDRCISLINKSNALKSVIFMQNSPPCDIITLHHLIE